MKSFLPRICADYADLAEANSKRNSLQEKSAVEQGAVIRLASP